MKKTKEELVGEIEELKKQLSEANDKYIRCLADYQNLKKQSDKSISSAKDDGKIELFNDLLPLIDSINAGAKYKDDDKVLKDQLYSILHKIGFKEHGVVGEKYDSNIHNAVMVTDSYTVKSGEINQVFKESWTFNDKIASYGSVSVER